MTESLLKTAAKIGFGSAVVFAASAAYLGRTAWAAGVFVGACWMFLNIYFLFRLMAVGMRLETPKNPNQLFILSMLKFPVIYLTGYFILKSRVFPVESLAAGLTAVMAGLVVAWILIQPATSVVGSRKSEVGKQKNIIRQLVIFSVLTSVFCLPSTCFASEQVPHEAALVAHETHDAAHGEGHGEGHGGGLHTTNLVGLLNLFLPENAAKMLSRYENLIFGALVIFILGAVFAAASRGMKLVPGRLQCACEAVVEGLNGFVCGIIGPEGRKYTPFLGTLFLYILTMNLLGLIPLMKSNTANSMTLSGPVALPVPTTTVALALIVFVTVQAIGIRKQGIVGYLDHMAGTPRDAFGWVMAPLMFPIHLIGEFAKPFSLTFRLFCNTMGGHILVAVFIGMGVGAMFIPFQAPFLLFEIATSTIQAFVFTLLSTVYIAMMMPHGPTTHPDGSAVDAAHH